MKTLTVSRRLDRRFREIGSIKKMARPPRGWIKAIRQSLGMSALQFGRRMGVSQPSVVALEQSEAANRVQLGTLQRAAEALNCTLVYVLVPNQPLEDMVRARARRIAARHLAEVERSMTLEDQTVDDPAERERQLDALAEQVDARSLWDEP